MDVRDPGRADPVAARRAAPAQRSSAAGGPRWLGITGLTVSTIYLLNQGDILATAVPGFPIWDLAGLLGSTSWGLWIAALGVTLLRRPISNPIPDTSDAPMARTSTPRPPITVGPRSGTS